MRFPNFRKRIKRLKRLICSLLPILKDTDSHAKEIEEREKTIADKTRRIYDLRKKTQELEKFKFVLDYKIKELKRDIGPREEVIIILLLIAIERKSPKCVNSYQI